MIDRTLIFFCYKKRDAAGKHNVAPSDLCAFLGKKPEYKVWMDSNLAAGVDWGAEIFENLIPSDVFILAIGEETSESDWVRRELSMAQAFGIRIIPVGLNITEEVLHKEMDSLGLANVHYAKSFNTRTGTAEGIADELAEPIRLARNYGLPDVSSG